MIQGNIEATDLKYPAVTLCPKVSTRYGIAERLGNYIDPLKLPKGLISLRHDYFMCASGLTKYWSTPKDDYEFECIDNGYMFNACKVIIGITLQKNLNLLKYST